MERGWKCDLCQYKKNSINRSECSKCGLFKISYDDDPDFILDMRSSAEQIERNTGRKPRNWLECLKASPSFFEYAEKYSVDVTGKHLQKEHESTAHSWANFSSDESDTESGELSTKLHGADAQKMNVTPEKESTGHIMISYSWADQKKVIPIKEALKKANYHVWMDVDNMKGSTFDAMAGAVEKAAVVLVCMSSGYRKSDNCSNEAKYAATKKKDIIPLLMEAGFNADGWLGIIVQDKLYFDFSGKYPFKTKIIELIKELGSRGKHC